MTEHPPSAATTAAQSRQDANRAAHTLWRAFVTLNATWPEMMTPSEHALLQALGTHPGVIITEHWAACSGHNDQNPPTADTGA